MRHLRCSMVIVLLLSSGAKADKFCFASAETYYEQVYCQLEAKAQVKNLPPFQQFKKNNEQVQYSLLKRPAERNAIRLPAPVKQVVQVESPPKARQPFASEPDRVQSRNPIAQESYTKKPAALLVDSSCELRDRYIHCADATYALVGNKANHRLAAGVLDSANTMALPVVSDSNASLTNAYEQYIGKMCEIGLGAVTMTYRKFAYLYQDLQTKGLDFSQRFETMFGFLKKDKAAMAVSESVNLPAALSLADCSALGSRYYACDYQGRNYIFVRQ
jgi:hypothetical protein